jgi:hypothetical protein
VQTYKRDWLQVAPEDETTRREYFIRLLSLLARRVSDHELEECIDNALCPRGRDRGGWPPIPSRGIFAERSSPSRHAPLAPFGAPLTAAGALHHLSARREWGFPEWRQLRVGW